MHRILISVIFIFSLVAIVSGQNAENAYIKNVNVTQSKAIYLGLTKAVSEISGHGQMKPEKRERWKQRRQVPDNFKGRSKTKVVFSELEHQGPDKLRQSTMTTAQRDPTVPIVNFEGLTSGDSPNDPSGDIGKDYYMQAINATSIAIYDKEGNLETSFIGNSLWSSLNVTGRGDPIILYDEQTSQWIITEFASPTDLLIAVSETSSPLGSYHVYRFSVPNFPDYPKYGIWTDHLVVTSNETGTGRARLHQYFIDRAALLSGSEDVVLQRVEIEGTTGSEQNFITSTPVDWNGPLSPDESSPIVLLLDDSSWGVAPEDGLRFFRFNVDLADENNTTVDELFIPLSPYDSYPCSGEGVGFACIPQLDGDGIDGLPELILNVPHYRRFDTHESIVFAFVTDATDGENIAGIRWTELRRSAEQDWSVYQEGTFAPDDGMHRFMAGIAIDKFQNIGMAYSVSSPSDYAGLRYTGRRAEDPLGIMTVPEVMIQEGSGAIRNAGRFGDYTQMSIDAQNGTTFWFTGEYGGASEVKTKIVAFELDRDTFDLQVVKIDNPNQINENLTASESVQATIENTGIEVISNPTISLSVDGTLIVVDPINVTLSQGETFVHTFSTSIDLSEYRDYQIEVEVSHPEDSNLVNNILTTNVENLPSFDLSIEGNVASVTCPGQNQITATIINTGFNNINGGVTVTLIEVDGVDNTVVATENISDPIQGAGGQVSYDFDVEMNSVGLLRYRLEVSPVGFIAESNESNNTTELEVNIDPNSVNIQFQILFDDFSEETSFEIIDPSTTEVIFQSEFAEGEQEYVLNFCLPAESCYLLRMFDSYGDGMCCDFGEGSYNLTYVNGEVLLDEIGNFGFSQSQIFCVEMVDPILSVDDIDYSEALVNVYPNPTSDIVNIEISDIDLGDYIVIQLRDTSGKLLQEQYASNYSGSYLTTISLMSRPAGNYFMSVQGSEGLGVTTITKL